jgi:excisionase family DNA binding protein
MHEAATQRNSTDGVGTPSSDQIAYTVPHAARILDIGDRTAWQLVHSGAIDSIKIGRARRVTRAALMAYIDSLAGAA